MRQGWRHPDPWRRGRWPFRETWLSFCSAHRIPKAGCRTCEAGEWSNDLGRALSSAFFRASPRAWRLWANRSPGWPRRLLGRVLRR